MNIPKVGLYTTTNATKKLQFKSKKANDASTNSINRAETPSVKKEETQHAAPWKTLPVIKKTDINYIKTSRALTLSITPKAEETLETAKELAIISNSPEVETWHVYLAMLTQLQKFFSDENSQIGEDDNASSIMLFTQTALRNDVLTKENREKILEKINEQIVTLYETHIERDQQKYYGTLLSKPSLSKNTIRELSRGKEIVRMMIGDSKTTLNADFFEASSISKDKVVKDLTMDLLMTINKIGFTDKFSTEDKHHIGFYDNKADIMWKNISNESDVIVLNPEDNDQSFEFLKKSFVNLIHKPNQEYANIDPEDTEIICLNDKADFGFLDDLTANLMRSPKNRQGRTVIVANLSTLAHNSDEKDAEKIPSALENINSSKNTSKKINLVLTMPQENYHIIEKNDSGLNTIFSKYAVQNLPILNATDAKQHLTSENGINYIKHAIKKDIDKDAVERAIEYTSNKKGNYPGKAIEYLDRVAKHFVEKDKIESKDITEYNKELENLSEKSNLSQSNIIFDTGLTLDDIVGNPMAKNRAELIVKKIKANKMGTTGIIIGYSDFGPKSGGRRHFVEAIAGEAKVPMITTNARDFALKDIDTISASADYTEIKIKNLISTAKAQAEANNLKTAIVYIDNFENFGASPLAGLSSIYEQKAFNQLKEEMRKLQKENKLNIIFVGSTNLPRKVIDDSIIRPDKFMEYIELHQPQSSKARKEVLEYYIDKMGIKIDGDKNQVLQNMAESTDRWWGYIDLIQLLKEAENVAFSKDRETISYDDFLTAILNVSLGEINQNNSPYSDNKTTVAHEMGHAINTVILNRIMEKLKIPYILGNKLDYVSFTPRSDYGGATFSKGNDKNETFSYEVAMQRLITIYGGYSSESGMFNISGSAGISEDLLHAESMAKTMVGEFGMGPRTGVRHINPNEATEEERLNYADDVKDFLETARKISNQINETYRGFIQEITDEYTPKTLEEGDCKISASELEEKLDAWIEKQSSDKKKEIERLEKTILKEIEECRTEEKEERSIPYFE